MEELFIAADGEPSPLDDPSGISFAEMLINRHDAKSAKPRQGPRPLYSFSSFLNWLIGGSRVRVDAIERAITLRGRLLLRVLPLSMTARIMMRERCSVRPVERSVFLGVILAVLAAPRGGDVKRRSTPGNFGRPCRLDIGTRVTGSERGCLVTPIACRGRRHVGRKRRCSGGAARIRRCVDDVGWVAVGI